MKMEHKQKVALDVQMSLKLGDTVVLKKKGRNVTTRVTGLRPVRLQVIFLKNGEEEYGVELTADSDLVLRLERSNLDHLWIEGAK